MNPELTERLYTRYPRLYQGRCRGIEQGLMARGFCCGDGWFALIDALSAAIEEVCLAMKARGCPESDLPIATQVKEKFGSLRFRVAQYPPCPEIEALIEAARLNSESLCDGCGARREAGRCNCPASAAEQGG